jgi:16S rRNA (uracil1498-N3)-methyltransferase
MKFSHLTRIHDTSLLKENQILSFEGERFHYIKTVLRMKAGEKFRVFNGNDGEYLAEITQIKKDAIMVCIKELFRACSQEKKLSLAICLIKPDLMQGAIKAAVQLGVTEIIPIISERTQTKIINSEKTNKAIMQATEQSERFEPPLLQNAITLDELLEKSADWQIIFTNEEETNNSIKDIKSWQEQIMLLVGPEGGFTESEQIMINNQVNTISVSLGNNVLRSETATIAALASIVLIRG